MQITLTKITTAQKTKILEMEESHFLDLKGIDIKPSKLTKTISAFANAGGGELYIGIDESEIRGKKTRQWKGFKDQEAANAHLQVFEQLFPLGQYYSYTFLSAPNSDGIVLQAIYRPS